MPQLNGQPQPFSRRRHHLFQVPLIRSFTAVPHRNCDAERGGRVMDVFGWRKHVQDGIRQPALVFGTCRDAAGGV